jgi:translation elongation factor EF-Tu-like GTPase
MKLEDIDRYAAESGKCVSQIAMEEGWDLDQLKAAWEYCLPFQQTIKEYVQKVPQELMRMGFVMMIESLKAVLNGTTQVFCELERGEFNEEDLA